MSKIIYFLSSHDLIAIHFSLFVPLCFWYAKEELTKNSYKISFSVATKKCFLSSYPGTY